MARRHSEEPGDVPLQDTIPSLLIAVISSTVALGFIRLVLPERRPIGAYFLLSLAIHGAYIAAVAFAIVLPIFAALPALRHPPAWAAVGFGILLAVGFGIIVLGMDQWELLAACGAAGGLAYERAIKL
jgi:hypothetical protein